jgi:hypothetical protein
MLSCMDTFSPRILINSYPAYRVAADAAMAGLLFDALERCKKRVWLDNKRHRLGEDWETGFLAGLAIRPAVDML